MARTKVHLVYGDTQIPYHDPGVLGMIHRFGSDLQPDSVIHVGDLGDFNSVADPKKRRSTKQQLNERFIWEVESCKTFLEISRDHFACAKYALHEGNHDDRVTRFIDRETPQFQGLTAITIPALLGLKQMGIEWYPRAVPQSIGALSVTHGHVARSSVESTAKAMMRYYGTSVLFGHIHRGGALFEARGNTVHGGWSNFCTCDLQPPYSITKPDWQQGFSVVYQRGDWFQVMQVPIINKQFNFAGQHYSVNRADLRMFSEVPHFASNP